MTRVIDQWLEFYLHIEIIELKLMACLTQFPLKMKRYLAHLRRSLSKLKRSFESESELQTV